MKLKQIPEDFIVEEIPLNKNFLDKGKYQIFLLEKKDYDTEKIILKLSEIFKIPRKFFSYAGTKDRKAITKQYCSVKVIGNKKLTALETDFFKIKILGFSNETISLGNLKGNHFIITIRDLEHNELGFFLNKLKEIEKKNKKEIEFVNYFDEQRFSKKNYEIGFSLIKKDFKNASQLIYFSELEKHLELNKNDYIGAIKKVPFKILTMYINSVQSYLFNEICVKYVKEKTKKYFGVDYHLTENKIRKFIFTDEKIKNIKLPLVSFDTEIKNNQLKKIVFDVLDREKINLNDFVIRQFPELTAQGSERDLLTKAKDINFLEFDNDELNNTKKKIKIRFTLSKGSYATLFIKYLYSTFLKEY